jgi:hypothetical protein
MLRVILLPEWQDCLHETGLRLTVPFFIEVGDKVKIDTRTLKLY